MVHVVRNAVDQGIEHADARVRAGKPEAATIELTAGRRAGQLSIGARDGRGIDWETVRAKAARAELPHREDSDRARHCSRTASLQHARPDREMSGRGMGPSALRQEVEALGGRIEDESTLGKGSQFRFKFDERSP